MVQCKSLLVTLAAASVVVAGPCKPSTTSPVLSTTTAIEETGSIETSTVSSTTAVDTTTIATTTTIEADTTTNAIEQTSSTEASPVVDTTIVDTSTVEATTTAALTKTTAEADATTTTTVAETTTTAPCAAAPTACGIYGYFVTGNTLQYITSPGTKDTAKDCVQACADYPGCDVANFYYQVAPGYEKGVCEFYKGTVKTDGQVTPYQWYQVCCLADM
ncbi:hypothetical protein FVEG_13557 [Fusarium verticillioides 7600]|uniref:Apple domain-containing protein n=2 Tax=Fusarium TaxID=5506 RepID=W7NGN5_GIBM7|nr:hypothetical protein FVEG_13557 [Fusarium verticillioides 7600]XP_044677314.1 hypothetical protein J7337_011211 [Fusarium musae]RBQ78867.1 hypothetical protein FVER14953_13557 [Fusarium verticillioides]EWG55572.1 hypothetical protein FVEG_13557 [Fusarium verticillioides 7600]KAG9498314.1 hypothetical protein J7337_011211 [Fusarium musae]RBQ87945.1 hypothetical protein FVER53263_13557 [Fusarium verticillioides]RBR13753.1 hypothetical protein FVER53590_13557 [Fusarium verticillioides]